MFSERVFHQHVYSRYAKALGKKEGLEGLGVLQLVVRAVSGAAEPPDLRTAHSYCEGANPGLCGSQIKLPEERPEQQQPTVHSTNKSKQPSMRAADAVN